MEESMTVFLSKVLAFFAIIPMVFSGQVAKQSRIERIERGLRPAVLIKGDPTWLLQERMKHYKVPGVSIAVINGFKIEWARGYGVKDVETNEPVTEATRFQAASISKPVAAMVALKKVEEGKLALDENVNTRLASWKLPENELTAKKKVTLANLLSHTAGLTVHGFPGYEVGAKLPTVPQILDGAEPANTAAVRVDLEPGTRFRYSGGGTTVAQLLLMDVEKKPFPQIAQETVLGPLQMTNSTYSQPLPDDARKTAASGHRGDGSLVGGKIHVYPEMAPAGLWTTPTDLAKFAIEVALSHAGRSNKILSKEMIEKMLTPYIDGAGGLGFFFQKMGNAIYFGQGGANEGFRCQLTMHKEKGYGAVVMVNSDNGRIIEEIVRAVAREYAWEDYVPQPYETTAVSADKLEPLVGRYLVNPDQVLSVTRENGSLFGEPTVEPKFELLPISETTFVRRDENNQYTFARNAAGGADAVTIRSPEGESTARRIPNDVKVPLEHLLGGKPAEALEGYRKIKKEDPASVAVVEPRLNSLGYRLLGQKRYADAIAVFSLNVELYPESSNTYDSLGEAYMLNGDRELAVKNYKRSLELNPRNANAAAMLKKLGQ
jgi:CubicO group peptidase (beta-lactamase class C family)